MSCGDIYSRTVTVNGRTVYSSRYSPCCYNYYMNSCWGMGYGFGGFGCGFWPGNFGSGLGMGLGFGAGMILTSVLGNLLYRNA